MGIEDRIVYSDDWMRLQLENALDRLKYLRCDGQYRRLLGDAFTQRLEAWESDILRRKDDPFTVVIVGDFKRGKSTLINALLGEEVVTTDVTTETVTLNRISYGAHSSEAVLSGGRRVHLADDELRRNELERLRAQLGEPITRLELKRPCELLKKVTIIDTPGTGDAMQDYSDMVKDSLLQADAVIYVYNIRYPLSQSEQMFLRSAVLPQKYTTLFLVGNFTDTLDAPEDCARMREMLTDRVRGLLPDAEVLMVSALDELCRQLEKKRPSGEELRPLLESQFDRLRELLSALVGEKADSVVLDRMQRLSSAMVDDLTRELDAIESGLEMSGEETAEALAGLRQAKEESVAQQTELLNRIRDQVQQMKQQTCLWMGEFLERIADETKNLGAASADDLRKYYEFYCVDLLQEALTACLEYHQDQLYDRLDEISDQLSKKLALGFEHKPDYQFRFHLDNRIWTKGDTVGLAVSFLSSTGFLATVASLAADGISGVLREREAKTRTPELLQQIAGKLTGLSASVTEAVERLYRSMGDNAQKLITEYYNDELVEKERLLNQAIAVSAKEEDEKAEMRRAVAEAKELLARVASQSGGQDA